jgi:hypothetical protein
MKNTKNSKKNLIFSKFSRFFSDFLAKKKIANIHICILKGIYCGKKYINSFFSINKHLIKY